MNIRFALVTLPGAQSVSMGEVIKNSWLEWRHGHLFRFFDTNILNLLNSALWPPGVEAVVSHRRWNPCFNNDSVYLTNVIEVVSLRQRVTRDAMKDWKVRCVDVDFDDRLTINLWVWTFWLLHILVVVITYSVDTTTPLEVKAFDVALMEQPTITREPCAL